MSKIEEKLDKIIELLENLPTRNEHSCKNCKAMVANGAILCPSCGQTDP